MGGELQTRDGCAAPLAVVGLVASLAAWLSGASACGRCGVLGAVVPFTLIVIMPTNHRLLGIDPDTSSVESRDLLIRWGKLHAVRTVLSLLAATLMLWQLAAGL